MFGLGFWEILMIALVVIVFVPPRQLPKFFYRIGSIYGELRAINRNVRRTMRAIERDINDAEAREAAGSGEKPEAATVSGEADGETASSGAADDSGGEPDSAGTAAEAGAGTASASGEPDRAVNGEARFSAEEQER